MEDRYFHALVRLLAAQVALLIIIVGQIIIPYVPMPSGPPPAWAIAGAWVVQIGLLVYWAHETWSTWRELQALRYADDEPAEFDHAWALGYDPGRPLTQDARSTT